MWHNDAMTDDLSDDDLPEEDEGEEDEEDGSGGDDHAALTLETPESAAAIAAAMAGNKKGPPGKKTGKNKGKDGAKGVGVALDDSALGLDEGAEDDEPEAEEGEEAEYQSSIDRDEITDPEVEDRIDPLAALLGGQDKPWENEKLSVAERMLLQEGYLRNDPRAEGDDPDAEGGKKPGSAIKSTVKAAGIAAGIAAGVAVAKGAKADGPGLAGVSRGPAHQSGDVPADTGKTAAVRQQEEQARQTQQRQQATPAGPANPLDAQQAAQQRQQQEVQERQRREMDTRLQAEQIRTQDARIRAETAANQKTGPDMAEILLHQQIANNANARMAANIAGGGVGAASADPDMALRTVLNRIYEALGLETLVAGMGERLNGWSQQTEGLRENARDLTEPQMPAPQGPAPELEQQRNMSINIGLGGP